MNRNEIIELIENEIFVLSIPPKQWDALYLEEISCRKFALNELLIKLKEAKENEDPVIVITTFQDEIDALVLESTKPIFWTMAVMWSEAINDLLIKIFKGGDSNDYQGASENIC